MKLSACMIVKNEEKTLGRALDSIQDLADEIIIVDTGSTDKTKVIALSYTKKIFDFAWRDDFSAARNFSLSKAEGDWILVLDADEVIAREDHQRIRDLLDMKQHVGYALKQISYTNDITQYNYIPFLLQDDAHKLYKKYAENFSGYIFCHIIRLFRNRMNMHFSGAVHESVDDSCKQHGDVMTTDIWLHHYQFERGEHFVREKQLQYLKIYEKNIDHYPNKARAYRDIGSIYYTYLNDYSTARTFFEKSLALQMNNKKTYIGLGLCYLKENNVNAALHTFEEGLKIFPGDAQLLHLKNMAAAA